MPSRLRLQHSPSNPWAEFSAAVLLSIIAARAGDARPCDQGLKPFFSAGAAFSARNAGANYTRSCKEVAASRSRFVGNACGSVLANTIAPQMQIFEPDESRSKTRTFYDNPIITQAGISQSHSRLPLLMLSRPLVSTHCKVVRILSRSWRSGRSGQCLSACFSHSSAQLRQAISQARAIARITAISGDVYPISALARA